jgi:cell division protein FtsB
MTSAAESAGVRPRSRFRFTPRAALLALLVTALSFYLLVPLRTYVAQRDRLNRLEQQTQVLEQLNAKLRRQIHRLDDPNYLERLARECLGMVKPDEIGFVITTKGGSPQQARDC